jgi:hypothetical protein
MHDQEEVNLEEETGHHIQEENEVLVILREILEINQHIQKERALVFPRENDLVIQKENSELHHELQGTRRRFPEERRTTHQEKILEVHLQMRAKKHTEPDLELQKIKRRFPEEKKTIHRENHLKNK